MLNDWITHYKAALTKCLGFLLPARACGEKGQCKLVARIRIKTKSLPLTKGQLLALVCTYLAVFLANQVVLWALLFLLRGFSL